MNPVMVEVTTASSRARSQRNAFRAELGQLSKEEGKWMLADAIETQDDKWFLDTRVFRLLRAIRAFGPAQVDLFLVSLRLPHSIYDKQIRDLTPRQREALIAGLRR